MNRARRRTPLAAAVVLAALPACQLLVGIDDIALSPDAAASAHAPDGSSAHADAKGGKDQEGPLLSDTGRGTGSGSGPTEAGGTTGEGSGSDAACKLDKGCGATGAECEADGDCVSGRCLANVCFPARDPGVVDCEGALTCEVATSACCCTATVSTCVMNPPTCATGSVLLECDETADCGGGDICCILAVGDPHTICRPGPCSIAQACKTDEECPSGDTCRLYSCPMFPLLGLCSSPTDATCTVE